MNKTITDKAQSLIDRETKSWLAEKLGISRVTLDNRLKNGKWKKTETQVILILTR